MIEIGPNTAKIATAPVAQRQDLQTAPTLEIVKNPFIPSNSLRNSLTALNSAVEVLGTQITINCEGSNYLVSASFKGKPVFEHRLYCEIDRPDQVQYAVKRDFTANAGGYTICGFQLGAKLDLYWLWSIRPQASLRWWITTASVPLRVAFPSGDASPSATMKIDVSNPQCPLALLNRWAAFSWLNGESAK